MRAVRELPRHSRVGLWSRLLRPRRVTVTPLPWAGGLLAAGLALAAVIGAQYALGDSGDGKLSAKAASNAPQPVQFVLVAPDAKKVSVVGDFNHWDVSH